ARGTVAGPPPLGPRRRRQPGRRVRRPAGVPHRAARARAACGPVLRAGRADDERRGGGRRTPAAGATRPLRRRPARHPRRPFARRPHGEGDALPERAPLRGVTAMTTPLDHPTPERPHRVYVALTNHCNRACPWCSTCSSPAGGTFLTLDDFERALPAEGPFEVQLEGGEPTVHPRFWDFVARARATERCKRLVLCTNAVVFPRRPERLASWLERLGEPL